MYDEANGSEGGPLEGGPPKPEKEDRSELEKMMTTESALMTTESAPTGYGSDGEQNNNQDVVVNSVCEYVIDLFFIRHSDLSPFILHDIWIFLLKCYVLLILF